MSSYCHSTFGFRVREFELLFDFLLFLSTALSGDFFLDPDLPFSFFFITVIRFFLSEDTELASQLLLSQFSHLS